MPVDPSSQHRGVISLVFIVVFPMVGFHHNPSSPDCAVRAQIRAPLGSWLHVVPISFSLIRIATLPFVNLSSPTPRGDDKIPTVFFVTRALYLNCSFPTCSPCDPVCHPTRK